MGILQLNFQPISNLKLPLSSFCHNIRTLESVKFPNHQSSFRGRTRAVKTDIPGRESELSSSQEKTDIPGRESEVGSSQEKTGIPGRESEVGSSQEEGEEAPSIDFAFVHSVLLPDGSPDIHYRSAVGGEKLRSIMMEGEIDLYGPYKRALLNCAGGGTCGTCLVEVVAGKELLSPRTDKEKEILKKKPKSWRLACQATVGNADSKGQVVIQTLPEWKAHEWEK